MFITRHQHHKKDGFTLIEMLVTMAIGTVVSFVLMVVVISGLQHVRKIKQKEQIETEANFIIEKMAYWIRQGKDLKVEGQILKIGFPGDLNLATKSFQIVTESGKGKIKLDGQPLNGNNVQVLTNPAFSYFVAMRDLYNEVSSVRINLVFSSSDIESFPVTTTLTKRNN